MKLSDERAEIDPKVFTKIHFLFTVRGRNLRTIIVNSAIKRSHGKFCSASIVITDGRDHPFGGDH